MRKVKILLTSFKGVDNKYGSRKRFIDLIDFIEHELTENHLEYDVARHVVISGDDLSKYDLVFVFMNALNSMTSSDMYGGLWALMKAKRSLPVFVDWRFIDFQSNMKHCVRGDVPFEKRFFNETLIKMGIRRHATEAKEHIPEFKEFLTKISKRGYDDIMFWAFNWFKLSNLDNEKLKYSGKAYTIDPSCFHLSKNGSIRTIREKGWVLDALSCIKPKLITHADKREWPIVGVGHPSIFQFDNVVRPFADKVRSSFAESSKLYGKYYGSIGFSYPHSGFGWWRQRIVIAADNTNVYIGDDKEQSLMGKSYRFTCDEVEVLSRNDVIKLAEAQREWLLDNIDSREMFNHRLIKIIHEKLETKCTD